MFIPTQSNGKLANRKTVYAQLIGVIDVILQNIPLYIPWKQFITVRVTLTIPSHWVPLKVMLILKNLLLNLLKIVILWAHKFVL